MRWDWLRGTRVRVAAVLGVVATAGTFFLPDAWRLDDWFDLALVFAVGALLAWPRVWPALALGGAFGYLITFDDPARERLFGAVGMAAVAGGVELWQRFGPRLLATMRSRVRLVSSLRTGDVVRRSGRAIRYAVTSSFDRSGQVSELPLADARQVLREGEVVLVIIAGTLYGMSWLAAQWFYGSFGVSPEEVGLTAADLLLAAGVGGVLVAVGILVLDTLWRKVRHPVLRVPLFTALEVALGGLGDLSAVIIYGVLFCAVAIGTSEFVPEARPRSRGWILSVTGLALVGLLVLAYGFADEMRPRLAAVEPATPKLGTIQIAALWAPTVRVWPIEGQHLPPDLPPGGCAHRLGNAYGITVFLRAGRVVRVPTQNVVSAAGECR
ncbi:hypothetical protein [Actinokineospora terrae]|uniref:Uncharacterized protein n=1 Tax=Actinokineospora terrae TaxID=155974 RepID=A0A1H9MMR7_9PSEU|nr:hypothetical protein [Actinokineospora terrae]SER25000.1 hypothetical protein SAMN04487818_102239 [Actinokineospora terrae]